MKLTVIIKAILHSIPGYQRRVLKRKTQQLATAKAQLLSSAERKLKVNSEAHLEYVYSQGVQTVLQFYDQETRALERTLQQSTSPTRTYPTSAVTQ